MTAHSPHSPKVVMQCQPKISVRVLNLADQAAAPQAPCVGPRLLEHCIMS